MNQQTFRSMKPIGDELYEIQFAHRRISLNLPIIIGVQILFEAKLEMLKFYYEFLLYFVPRDHIGTVLMDTGQGK